MGFRVWGLGFRGVGDGQGDLGRIHFFDVMAYIGFVNLLNKSA